MEIRDVAPGLWIWRPHYPDRHGGEGWEGPVTSTVVESGGEVAVIEPLTPHEDEDAVWQRLDAKPPTMVVILKPDHVRDVDPFVERFGVRAFGPWLYFAGDAPKTDLEPLEPDMVLPGGLVALYDGRWRMETPLWLPEQRAIVFADALTAPDGELRVWDSRAHEKRALPALRELLELPFEHVIISHGEPVHDREAYERALELPAYPSSGAAAS